MEKMKNSRSERRQHGALNGKKADNDFNKKRFTDEITMSKGKSMVDSSSTQADDVGKGNKKKLVVSKLKLNLKAAKDQASKWTVDPKPNPKTPVKPKSKEAESSRL
ncbi:hypothetical protein Tco_1538233 [Tanacetum coccineum]